MIDIHQHLLFGIDDGPSEISLTQQMLLSAHEQGIDTVIGTSHAVPGRRPFRLDKYLDALKQTRSWLKEAIPDMQLLPGSEIMYAPNAVPQLNNGELLTLAGTDHVLVEFYPEVEYEDLVSGIRKLINAGYEPVLAHMERYGCLRKHGSGRVEELKQMGVALQMNARTAMHVCRLFGDAFLKGLLKDGSIRYVATDAHDMKERPVCLKNSRDALTKLLGRERADALCGGNQLHDIVNARGED